MTRDEFDAELRAFFDEMVCRGQRPSLAAIQAAVDSIAAQQVLETNNTVTITPEPLTQDDLDAGRLRYTMTFPAPVYAISLPPLESDEFATLLTCDECGKTTDRIDFESNRPLCEDCNP